MLPIVELADWFQTPPGRYALAWEQCQIDQLVDQAFGFHACQLDLAGVDLLRANRIPFKVCVGAELFEADDARCGPLRVAADPRALPFADQSVDLLVLPHTLECTQHPHQVLREVERVLVPEGRVVLSGFNPYSLWGARNLLPGMQEWLPRPTAAQVSAWRLRDWLKLLSLEAEPVRYGCYAPPCRGDAWLARWGFLDKLGARWWPLGGSVYVVSAVKRVAGVRIIGASVKRKAWTKSKSGQTAPARETLAREDGAPCCARANTAGNCTAANPSPPTTAWSCAPSSKASAR